MALLIRELNGEFTIGAHYNLVALKTKEGAKFCSGFTLKCRLERSNLRNKPLYSYTKKALKWYVNKQDEVFDGRLTWEELNRLVRAYKKPRLHLSGSSLMRSGIFLNPDLQLLKQQIANKTFQVEKEKLGNDLEKAFFVVTDESSTPTQLPLNCPETGNLHLVWRMQWDTARFEDRGYLKTVGDTPLEDALLNASSNDFSNPDQFGLKGFLLENLLFKYGTCFEELKVNFVDCTHDVEEDGWGLLLPSTFFNAWDRYAEARFGQGEIILYFIFYDPLKSADNFFSTTLKDALEYYNGVF